MKVLIITYYFPPAGGSGVQRWLKFVKYLPDFGIDPVVYTVADPKYAIVDESLGDEIPKNIKILRQPIWEPSNLFSSLKKTNPNASSGFLDPNPNFWGRKLQYIRANYFIPDARKYWVKPSVKYLKKYLQKNKIDAIITTGPPHSLHLIGLQLKKELGLVWLSDFRDPWTDIDYFHQLPFTKKSKIKHRQMENQVLQNSDAVLVVGKTMKDNYRPFSKNIFVITNGFDGQISEQKPVKLDNSFSISHIGMINADRNPKVLWQVLAEIGRENREFKQDLEIKLIGKIDTQVSQSLKEHDFKNITEIDYLAHDKVKSRQGQSQVLLLTINNVPSAKGIITGKIFEYLQVRRPILGIGPPDGDAAEILNKTQSGKMIDFKDAKAMKAEILKLYRNFKNDQLQVHPKNIEQYHRKNLTEKLSDILKNVNS